MTAQNRVGREQGADYFESLPAKDLAFDRQSTPLVVVKQDPFLAELLFEYLVFCAQILDHFLLLTIDPAGEEDNV